jgi:hypothetical protein
MVDAEKIFHNFFHFKHPTTIAVTGPSQVGKSQFSIKLLKNISKLMNPIPSQIIWAYGVKNEVQNEQIMQENPNVQFVEGIPDQTLFNDPKVHSLVILDDLMNDIGKNSQIAKLFTVDSHHCNTSVIAILHNLFNQEKFSRTLALNTHYNIVFRSKRDKRQITQLNSQMFPIYPNYLQTAYEIATGKPFGYLVIDLHPKTPESISVHTGIFDDEVPIVFLPTNEKEKSKK